LLKENCKTSEKFMPTQGKILWLEQIVHHLNPGRKIWGNNFFRKVKHSKSPMYTVE
jgi:hypothetical protein